MPLSAVIESNRTNTVLAWAVVFALAVVAAGSLAFGALFWGGLSATMVAVALFPAATYRTASAMPPWEVLAVGSVPVALYVLNAPPPFLRAASYLAIAALAFLVVVELHVFSPVELTPGVAVVLVVLVTLAGVGVRSMVRYAVGIVLGTGIIEEVSRLMWDIVFASAVGIAAGPLTWAYLRWHESTGTEAFDLGDSTEDDGDDNGQQAPESTASADGDEDATLVFAVRGMQALLAGLTLFALVTFRWGLVINAGVSLAVTFLPAVLERDLGLPMDAGLVAWITLAVFLHAVGAVGPYQWFGWYDSVTHTLSASVVAGAGYASARALDLHYDSLTIPPVFIGAFVVVFVLAFGVVWEILEFASGGVASIIGGEAVLAQYGARDIVLDLAFNTVGGVLVALFGTSRLRNVATVLATRLPVRSG